jgi:hypothetical protein
MNSLQLHHQVVQQLARLQLPLSHPQQTNLALWGQALAVSRNCHLSNLALGLPFVKLRTTIHQ